jgi:hypothetical protein
MFQLPTTNHASVAWYLIPNNSCQPTLTPCFKTGNQQPCCPSKDNRGWRYFIAVLGCFTLFMFVCRFFLFDLLESPKFLLSQNRQSEAIEVVQRIARYNGAKTWLDERTLQQLASEDSAVPGLSGPNVKQRPLGRFSFQKVLSLFNGWQMATTTVLLWVIWLTYVHFPLVPVYIRLTLFCLVLDGHIRFSTPSYLNT